MFRNFLENALVDYGIWGKVQKPNGLLDSLVIHQASIPLLRSPMPTGDLQSGNRTEGNYHHKVDFTSSWGHRKGMLHFAVPKTNIRLSDFAPLTFSNRTLRIFARLMRLYVQRAPF